MKFTGEFHSWLSWVIKICAIITLFFVIAYAIERFRQDQKLPFN